MASTRTLSPGEHLLSAGAGASQADTLAGVWKLPAAAALRLRAAQDGELRIAHGRVWATFDGAGLGGALTGDHFLSRGEALPLRAGQTLVIESFGVGHAASAYFGWQPALQLAAEPGREALWVRPLAELRQAGALVAHALGALIGGLALGAGRVGGAALTGFAMIFVANRQG